MCGTLTAYQPTHQQRCMPYCACGYAGGMRRRVLRWRMGVPAWSTAVTYEYHRTVLSCRMSTSVEY
eukprot:2492353-Rhodomonas_salina.1